MPDGRVIPSVGGMAAATIGRLTGRTMASVRMLRPAGYLANRAAGRWVFDVLLTLLAGATAVAWASAPPYQNATHLPLGAARIVVLVLMVAPLVVRRIWPIPVFGVMVAAAIGAGDVIGCVYIYPLNSQGPRD